MEERQQTRRLTIHGDYQPTSEDYRPYSSACHSFIVIHIYIYISRCIYRYVCNYMYGSFILLLLIIYYRYPGDCRWGGMGHTIIYMMHCIDDRHMLLIDVWIFCFCIESNDIHLGICIGHTTTERPFSLDDPVNVHAPRSRQEHHTTHLVRPWQLAN